jgi:pyruvate/2-oxoglutarate dehydrogenase complex dihydrolipoamide dehydrogenase (E3) component
MRQFDAIIVGAGQAGPALAGRLTLVGRRVAIVERHLFGGTCVNTGCMPTKTLIASGYAAHVARRSGDFGVLLGSDVRIDMRRAKARADKVSADSRTSFEAWVRSMPGRTVLNGHTRFCSANEMRVGDDLVSAP